MSTQELTLRRIVPAEAFWGAVRQYLVQQGRQHCWPDWHARAIPLQLYPLRVDIINNAIVLEYGQKTISHAYYTVEFDEVQGAKGPCDALLDQAGSGKVNANTT